MTIEDNAILNVIANRRSVRGFLSDPVDPGLIRTILNTAARAPSGNNIQPWHVHVVHGEARDRLSLALLAAFNADTPMQPDYQYYPSNWRDPYLSRRRENGWSLYDLLGIQKGDNTQSKLQHARNFSFFGAPAVIFITIDGDMGKGSWLDIGMFIQTFMIAALAVGLCTCPQVALVAYPDIVRGELSIDAEQVLVCGISLGYEDSSHIANKLRTTRISVSEFAVFHQ